MKEQLNVPQLFNLRRDPFERTAEESGMYVNWLGKKMWAFGPAQAIVKEHLTTFKQWPPASSISNQEGLERSLEDMDSRR